MSLFTSTAESLATIDMLVWTKVPLPKISFIVEYSRLAVPTILKISHVQSAEEPMLARRPHARRSQETC